MQSKITRRLAVVIVAVTIAIVGRTWFTHPEKSVNHARAADASGQAAKGGNDSGRDTTSLNHGSRVASTASEPSPVVNMIRRVAPAQLEVRAPAAVRSGESFETAVVIDAPSGIRHLEFAVSYNKRVLQLVGASGGAVVQQGGASTHFGAEEPSDGNILVSVDVDNGSTIAGMGSVALLQFQTLQPGNSALTVHSVSFGDDGAIAPATTAGLRGAVVDVN